MEKGKLLDEYLVIGDSVQLFVMGFTRDQVRIGINAPKEIGVDREEIHQQKQGTECMSKHTKSGWEKNKRFRKKRQRIQPGMTQSTFLFDLS